MVRAATFLTLLAVLAASGWTLVQKNFRPTAPNGTLPTAAEVAVAELETASGVLERYHKLFQTYSGANLELFEGLRLARAGEGSYCLEVARAGAVWRLAGPGGTVASGGCKQGSGNLKDSFSAVRDRVGMPSVSDPSRGERGLS